MLNSTSRPESAARIVPVALGGRSYDIAIGPGMIAAAGDAVKRLAAGTRCAVVTDETVAAWRETLDVVDSIIDGELLIPHWRFKQGFDLAAFFANSERTDLVMLLTGQGALAYLADGPIADADSFALANTVFGENIFNYAAWFN